MRDEPQDPNRVADREPAPPPTFEPPHSNGAVHQPKPAARRTRRGSSSSSRCSSLILCIGIILGWTLVGLALARAARRRVGRGARRPRATTRRRALKALPNSDPRTARDAGRARSGPRTSLCATMVDAVRDGAPDGATPATALRGWIDDWERMIDARDALRRRPRARRRPPARGAVHRSRGQRDHADRRQDERLRPREQGPRTDACNTGRAPDSRSSKDPRIRTKKVTS